MRVQFSGVFAPAEGRVWPQEQPHRQETCLNGRWQFQPVAVPPEFRRGEGAPPELPAPRADAWERTPSKIPSPWNVNAWGTGHETGDPARPYDPGSIYFPSYPRSWERVEMGWLHRTFRVPPGWRDRRLVVHFEAVAGECAVWVNGRRAGGHFDSWLPFEVDITALVRQGGVNEILVGVRAHALFEKQSRRYPKMRAPYPTGSETERLAGIWQDVFLLGLPPVRIADMFVQPQVDRDTLALEVTVINDTARPRRVRVDGQVHPWRNLARQDDVLSAPEPRWTLGAPVLSLPPSPEILVPPGRSATLTLRQRVRGRLKPWTPDAPNLYVAALTLQQDGVTIDRRLDRFGWRQFQIHGRDLLLNGRPIQLFGDLLHPFGPFILSRRHVWAWYRAIKDFGGNCVRPHAQIHPRHYLELADEMGLIVLDETAIFGSSIALNFEEPVAWQRFAEHYEGLIRRDRNHPSVLGWSVGNELFAIFDLNRVSGEDADRWYAQLAELALRARALDPTRPWISCDGDEDLRGALPVWSKHFGHGLPLGRIPDIDKPRMVGESGGTYYARPAQLAIFNGERAYENYAGRSEALAIDLYENITQMARPRLAYFSASEIAWFGLEHLAFGYRDRRRLPGEQDGVFFTHPFAEGRPGIQPERLPPYVSTLNPGWDPALPLYKPLPLFEAARAALARPQPRSIPWKRSAPSVSGPSVPPPSVERAEFLGDARGELGRRLTALGVPLQAGPLPFTIVETGADPTRVKSALERLRDDGGVMLCLFGAGHGPPENLLPDAVRLTDHPATALAPNHKHPWTRNLTAAELYFAEDGENRFVQRYGLEGPLITRGRIVLRASDTDWSLFNNAPENAKAAAVVLYEHLVKPSGAALVEIPLGKGRIALCTLDYRVRSRAADTLWRKLLANMGLKLNAGEQIGEPAFEGDALVRALGIGRFGAAQDFLGTAVTGTTSGGLVWKPIASPSKDRFLLHEMGQSGPDNGPFAVYFSFWIHSPRALEDLLGGGPDAPRLGMRCYVSERCRLWLNGGQIAPARQAPADYRTLYTFENLPLHKGWNHFLIEVISERLHGDRPGTLAVRLFSDRDDYLRDLDSAIERQDA